MDCTPRKLVLTIVLVNGIICGLCSVLILAINQISLKGPGVFGVFDLGMIVFLSMAGMVTGFKIGDLYIFIYNIFAKLLKGKEIVVNYRV